MVFFVLLQVESCKYSCFCITILENADYFILKLLFAKSQAFYNDLVISYHYSFVSIPIKESSQILEEFNLQIPLPGLPWWRSGWESACQCRGHRFEPWSGKIPHAAEQRGPWATITEPARLELVLCNRRGRDNERPVHRDEEWPPLAATRESPRTEMKTQHSH